MFYESKAPTLTSLSDALSIDDSLYPGVRAYVLSKLWKQDNEKENAKEEMSGDEKIPVTSKSKLVAAASGATNGCSTANGRWIFNRTSALHTAADRQFVRRGHQSAQHVRGTFK
jgi:hypothetical protein